ncbi:MAG: porin family protein [Gammaproteobacteria bacterium]|nr:porin family protein [Gammaproteobacteria bacterium]
MEKHRLKLITCSALASIVFTISSASATSLYFGASMGPDYESWTNNYSPTVTVADKRNITLTTLQHSIGIDGGFRWNISKLFLDIDGGLSYYMLGAEQTYAGQDFKQTADYSYSFGMRFGMMVDPSNDAAIVTGYKSTLFKRTGNTLLALGNTLSKTSRGYEIGLMTQGFVSKNLAITTSYTHTLYPRFQTNNTVSGGASSESDDTKYNISTNQFNIGINYFFGGGKMKSTGEIISPFEASDLYGGVTVGQDVGYSNYETTQAAKNDYYQDIQGQAFGLYGGKKIAAGKASVGVEAELKYVTDKFDVGAPNATAQEYSLYREFEGSLCATPGMKINSTNVLYLRAGAALSEFHWGGNVPSNANISFKKLDPGVVIGLGDEVAITPHTTLRIQYALTRYLKIKKKDGPTQYNITPVTNSFSVGLAYYL